MFTNVSDPHAKSFIVSICPLNIKGEYVLALEPLAKLRSTE